MIENSPGARARDALEIQDVFLVRCECWVARDINPTAPMTEFTFGQRSGVEGEALIQERTPIDGAAPFHVVRYFIATDVSLLKPGVNAADREPRQEDTLAALKFIFAADYRCPRELVEDKEAIAAFSRNAHFHTWAYVREEVHSACARMRLPRITLPMLRPDEAVKGAAPRGQ